MKTARGLAEAVLFRAPSLWLPATLSFFGVLLAWAMVAADARSALPLGIITSFQAVLMLSGASILASDHAAMRSCWQRRVAPSTALRHVRRAFVKRLTQLAACALTGPLLMVAGLGWSRWGWDLLALAAAVLLVTVVMLLLGTALGERLQRGLSAWVGAGRRPISVFPWRWGDGRRRWRHLATQEEIDMARRGGGLWVWLCLLPQSLMQAPHWRFHAWGKTLTSGWELAGAALWMLLLGMFINAVIISPPLHWRSRLAPGGLSAAGWARRMVAGSMLNAMVWMSAVLALGMAVSGPEIRAVQLTAWAPVVADALLAVTWTLWMRGVRNNGFHLVLASLGLGGATALLLGVVRAMGGVPQRGTVLLVTELTFALIFAVGAQRAWARQDLNRLVPRS